jgi:putative ABC transport system permease protein
MKRPPKYAEKLLSSFLRSDLAEEVQGDLEEKFYSTLKKRSAFRAKVNYWYQVFHYMRPFAIRKNKKIYSNQYDMFQNYFKIGIRNLLKNKFFSFINITGMAISMAIVVIIYLYIQDEFSFDKHLDDLHLKYRVFNEHFSDDGNIRKGAMVPPMIGPAMAAEYPQVDFYTRFLNFNAATLFEVGDKRFTERDGGSADGTIFRMFNLTLLEGDPNTALSEPNSVAINTALKKKYFGDGPALGKSIEIFDQHFKVVAVFEDFPEHSHFQRNYFLSMQTIVSEERLKSWQWNQFHTYIKLKPASDAEALDASLKDFAKRNAWPITKPNGGYYIPHLMPVEKIHLHAYDQLWDIAVRGNAQTIYILIGTAIFILLISVLNFINLSTARAINRAKEVGVRKVVGALRRQLIYQFTSESVVIALIALVIAGFVTAIALPYVNVISEKNISHALFFNPGTLAIVLVFGIFLGICAGLYPAVYISANKPSQILSRRDSSGRPGKSLLRQGMVVFQFMLSFFLIIASFVVSEQHAYMRDTDMGFEKENIIVLPIRGEMNKNLETTKHAFMSHPNIESASFGYGLPGEAFAGDGIMDKATRRRWHINMLTVDHDYIKTLGLNIIAGRDFSEDIPSDQHHAFILSESAAKMLGYTDPRQALGHEILWNRWDAPDSLKEGKVIGIVKDIQLNSMRENIAPVALQIFPFAYATLSLRVKDGNLASTLKHLEAQWKSFNTEWPFEYRFLDENFDKMYKAEEKLSVLFQIFTGFTIFVACLGLFGLVVYSTTQRYREVSIRKVLGATERNLVLLLAKNYLLLISIAFVIAIPLSYYAATQWLLAFAFRIDLTPLLFIKAAFLISIIALLTVGIQSFKATRSNPVEALKEQ